MMGNGLARWLQTVPLVQLDTDQTLMFMCVISVSPSSPFHFISSLLLVNDSSRMSFISVESSNNICRVFFLKCKNESKIVSLLVITFTIDPYHLIDTLHRSFIKS